jgi:hypothetical protein
MAQDAVTAAEQAKMDNLGDRRINWGAWTNTQIRLLIQEAGQAGDAELIHRATRALNRRLHDNQQRFEVRQGARFEVRDELSILQATYSKPAWLNPYRAAADHAARLRATGKGSQIIRVS